MRRLLVPALGLIAAAALAPGAAAHAVLLRSEPANGAVVARGPAAVRFVFDSGIRVGGGNQAVRNGGGSALRARPRVEGGRTLVLPLARKLPGGDYSVRWSVVSEDGHHESGVIAFAVGAGRAPPQPQLRAGGELASEAVAARAFFFAGLLLAAGTAVFRLAVVRGRATLPLLLGGLAGACAGAAWLADGAPASTRFALAYTTGAAIAGVGALCAAAAFRLPAAGRAAELAAIALVPVPSIAGHALDPGAPRPLELTGDVLHVAAASVWTGGLAALLLSLGSPGVARRFSRIALAAVATLAVTGVVRALDGLSAVGQLGDTGYGRALIVKTVLVVLALALAWGTRERLFAGAEAGRRVGGELAILVGAIVAVAFLTSLPPGKDVVRAVAASPRRVVAPEPAPRPPPGALVLAQQDGKLAVALAARGPELTATVLGEDGGGVRGLGVLLRSAGRTAVARPCGPGCYRASLAHGRDVAVVLPGSRVSFRLPATAPPADALLRRATRVFRGLDSVSLQERLSSGPGHVVNTRFVFAAPNRMTYLTSEGSAAVVIGKRRWDRQGKGRWVESEQSPIPEPRPFWLGPLTNERLLGRAGGAADVSFYDPTLKAWFRARIDERTGRTLGLTMTAAAHFMHHSYSGFDAPVRIRPPR